MSLYDEQDELMRYGLAPECCPDCKERFSGMCKFHRERETRLNAGWHEWVCQNPECGALVVSQEPAPVNRLCPSCQPAVAEDETPYPLSRGD